MSPSSLRYLKGRWDQTATVSWVICHLRYTIPKISDVFHFGQSLVRNWKRQRKLCPKFKSVQNFRRPHCPFKIFFTTTFIVLGWKYSSSSLFSSSDFSRSSITSDLGRNLLKRGTEKFNSYCQMSLMNCVPYVLTCLACRNLDKSAKILGKQSKFGKYFVRNNCPKSSKTSSICPKFTVTNVSTL